MKRKIILGLSLLAFAAFIGLSGTAASAAPAGYSCSTYLGGAYDDGDGGTCQDGTRVCSNGQGGSYNYGFTTCVRKLAPL